MGRHQNITFQPGTTVSAAWYSGKMKSKLKPAIRNKCEGFLYKGILWLSKNVLPHSAAGTVEATRQPKFELLPTLHPPYRQDLAPSDNYIVVNSKRSLAWMKICK
jgi:hypothetical protein